jgi:hypothetical protein
VILGAGLGGFTYLLDNQSEIFPSLENFSPYLTPVPRAPSPSQGDLNSDEGRRAAHTFWGTRHTPGRGIIGLAMRPIRSPLSLITIILWFVACLWSIAFAQQSSPTSAETRFRSIIQQIERVLPTLADRGAGLFALARLYAQIGDAQKALTLLKESLASDEGFDPSGSEMLAPLRSNPEFARLAVQPHKQYPPVHSAKVAFTVPEKDLFPEGLAYDPATHVFYMGSMYRRKIIRITDKGEVSDFVKPDLYHLQPIGGVHVDPADQSLWAASDPDDAHGSELYHFDRQGKLLEQYSPGTGRHDLNDLVLYHSSAIYVTDTDANLTYRFDRKTHLFTPLNLPRLQLFPNGITLSDDSTRLYIADWLGVMVVDLRDNSAHEVNPGEHNTLCGIDGLY